MRRVLLSLVCLIIPGLTMAAAPDDLRAVAPSLSTAVADRAIDAIACAQQDGLKVDKLIVVDMAKRSSEKRLWAFDLTKGEVRLVLNDRVAHGSGSDRNNDGIADDFSNTPNSNMTSLGLYRIAERYQGKNGWSRRLDGLFKRFNSKARDRAVVMHPSTYVGPGHVGRSQGCPAVNQDTMTALEKAGLTNAVLWIDAPNSELVARVEECANKQRKPVETPMARIPGTVLAAQFDASSWMQPIDAMPVCAAPSGLMQDPLVCLPPLPSVAIELADVSSATTTGGWTTIIPKNAFITPWSNGWPPTVSPMPATWPTA